MHIYELKTCKLYFKSVLYFHSKRLPLELKDLHLIQLQGVENTFTLGLFPTEQSIIIYCITVCRALKRYSFETGLMGSCVGYFMRHNY